MQQFRRATLAAGIAASALLCATLAAPMANADAAAATCTASASKPINRSGTIVYGGGIRCSSRTDIHVRVVLMWGLNTEYADTDAYCDNSTTCNDTGLTSDWSGDQLWCTKVIGENIPAKTVCERESW